MVSLATGVLVELWIGDCPVGLGLLKCCGSAFSLNRWLGVRTKMIDARVLSHRIDRFFLEPSSRLL